MRPGPYPACGGRVAGVLTLYAGLARTAYRASSASRPTTSSGCGAHQARLYAALLHCTVCGRARAEPCELQGAARSRPGRRQVCAAPASKLAGLASAARHGRWKARLMQSELVSIIALEWLNSLFRGALV